MPTRAERDMDILRVAAEHFAKGRAEEALAGAQKVLKRSPSHPQANQIAATAFTRKNMLPQAVFHAERAVAADPRNGVMHASLGQVYLANAEPEKSLASFERSLQLDPTVARTHISLGTTLQQLHRYEDAIASIDRGLDIDPDALDGWTNRATTNLDIARADEAVKSQREAIKREPNNPYLWTVCCNMMNYPSGLSADEVFAAHRRYGAIVEKGLRDREVSFANTKDPDRVLRIGYLSRDMRMHSCAYFLLPLLQSHDASQVESYCYSHSRHVDEMTEEIRQACTVFRDCTTASNEELKKRIEADRIDILVELAGHSALHKLDMLAHRCAPIQATYLGYPHTTGLMNIQYRIVDGKTDPEDAPPHATEELHRLPNTFLCYAPPPDAPAVAPSTAAEGKPFTFGSFNEAKKISHEIVELWSSVLKAVPQSNLLLKAGSFDNEVVRRDMVKRFEAHGIDAERLEIVARTPSRAEHLAYYHRVDLALDTFPYHGTTTTCEAMWMGVPTVSLRGDRHASRVGASLLQTVGLDDLIADSHAAFIEIATKLATDGPHLQNLRLGLRDRMASSPLCDGPQFARDLENAYRAWWTKWCLEENSDRS